MTDESNIIAMPNVEMPIEDALRDLETEIHIANATIEKLRADNAELFYTKSQLEDIARVNTAGKLLPYFLDLHKKAGVEHAMNAAIQAADKFVSHYVGIMEANSKIYRERIMEQQAAQPAEQEQETVVIDETTEH